LTTVLSLLLVTQLGSEVTQQESEDRIFYFVDFVVEEGEQVRDAVCVFCSADIKGIVEGDAVTVFGNLIVSGTVMGDAVSAGGFLEMTDTAELDSDIVAVGGSVWRHGSKRTKLSDSPEDHIESHPFIHLPGQRHLLYPGAGLFLFSWVILVILGSALIRRHILDDLLAALRTRVLWLLFFSFLAPAVLALIHSMMPDTDSSIWGAAEFILMAFHGFLFLLGSIGIAFFAGAKLCGSRSFWTKSTVGAILSGLLLLIPLVGILAISLIYLGAVGLSSLVLLDRTRKFWLLTRS
jgi:hypothetical protein